MRFLACAPWNGRQRRVLSSRLREQLAFACGGVQTDLIVCILALAERCRLVASCNLLSTGSVVRFLLVTARAAAFLNRSAHTAVLNLLVLARKNIVA